MRKIKFDEQTIQDIKRYLIEEKHTISEASNKFTIKTGTLRRILFENNIRPIVHESDRYKQSVFVYNDIDENLIKQVCLLYKNTKMRINDICKEVKLKDYEVQAILNKHFTKEYRDNRKAKLYRESKLGDKNPMSGKYGNLHHNYKGLVEDGDGYYMCLKPEWYTGRKNSKHIFYHSKVICEYLHLTEIPKGFVVHHIDGNKKNNDISNLCLLSISAHAKLHQFERKLIQGAETIHKEVGNNSEMPNNNRLLK